MKKLFVLLMLSASAIFVSCNKDDDDAGNETKIIGKWEFTQVGTEIEGQEILTAYENDDVECGKDFVEFRADNTASQVEFFRDFNEECDSETETATYSVSGNNLTASLNGESGTLEILTLNNTTLKLKTTEEFEGETFVLITVLTKI